MPFSNATCARYATGGVTVHFPAGLTPHVPQKITMSKAGAGGVGANGGVRFLVFLKIAFFAYP